MQTEKAVAVDAVDAALDERRETFLPLVEARKPATAERAAAVGLGPWD